MGDAADIENDDAVSERREMPKIEDFGLTPKYACQVGCPVLKKIYDSVRKRADDTAKQVRPDDTERNKGYFSGYEGALHSVAVEIGCALSPAAVAGLLDSMGAPEESEDDD